MDTERSGYRKENIFAGYQRIICSMRWLERSISVLVSYGCCNKLPQAGWLKIKIYSFTVLEAKDPKSRFPVRQGHDPSRYSGERYVPFLFQGFCFVFSSLKKVVVKKSCTSYTLKSV